MKLQLSILHFQINEQGQTLLETYAKPFNKITSYNTVHSGINTHTLSNVSIRLEDVQRAIQRLLPPDAILCGHSIEHDLNLLQMFHP